MSNAIAASHLRAGAHEQRTAGEDRDDQADEQNVEHRILPCRGNRYGKDRREGR
jgi:hypothetical protein